MKVYISGKISGIEEEAPALFKQGAKEVVDMGYGPLNPFDLAHLPNGTWEDFMKRDIQALCDCDAIYMLENWPTSKGAEMELDIAEKLGLRVIWQKPKFNFWRSLKKVRVSSWLIISGLIISLIAGWLNDPNTETHYLLLVILLAVLRNENSN